MKILNFITSIIVAIGGLNWFSVGVFQFDIISNIFGGIDNWISRIIYILVGVSTLFLIYSAISERGIINMNCCAEKKKKEEKQQKI